MKGISVMDIVLILGIVGAVISTIGLIVASLAGMYYLGYSRGEGDWRYDDYFAPRPVVTSVDKEIAAQNKELRQRCFRLAEKLRDAGVEID
jgi:hypothetical protein